MNRINPTLRSTGLAAPASVSVAAKPNPCCIVFVTIMAWGLLAVATAKADVVLEFGELESTTVVPLQVFSSPLPQSISIGVFATTSVPNQTLVSFDIPLSLSPTSIGELVGAENSILPKEGNFGYTDSLAPNGIELVVFDDVPFENGVPMPVGTSIKLFDLSITIPAGATGDVQIEMPWANGVVDTLDLRNVTNALLEVPSSSRQSTIAFNVSAVPEPSPIGTLGVACCCFAWWRRGRRIRMND